MHKYKRLWLTGSMAILLLAAAGCFQAAGTGPDALSVAENSNPTWTPFPSDTPFPTAEPLVITATQDPNAFIPPTEDFGQSPSIQEFPTQDTSFGQFPTEDTAFAQFPTEDTSFVQVPTLDPNFAQQVDPNIDPIYVTATYIVARATMTEAFFMTATAGGPIFTATQQETFLPGVPTATSTPVPGGPCTYVVAAGENLFRISMKYGMTPQDLATANGIPNMNIIMVGQTLNIPNCGATAPAPIPGATAVPPVGSGTTYTVIQGDTLFSISLKFGVPVTSIAAANGISNINLIVVNQQLVIPPA
jgi:LysM repeat protein